MIKLLNNVVGEKFGERVKKNFQTELRELRIIQNINLFRFINISVPYLRVLSQEKCFFFFIF